VRALLAVILAFLPGAARAQDDDGQAQPRLVPAGGILLFYNSTGPLSFETATPGHLPPGAVRLPGELQGSSCQYALAIPLSASLRATSVSGAKGDGSYEKALGVLRAGHPELSGVYDVKVDLHVTSVLGVFRRLCTEITARGFR
jgi:hypothetical protein